MEARQEAEVREYLRQRGVKASVGEYAPGGPKLPVGIVSNRSGSALARAYREEFLKATDEAKVAEVLASRFPTSDNIKALAAIHARIDIAAHRLAELANGFAL